MDLENWNQLMALANSEAGQKLLAIIQQRGSSGLMDAMQKAQAGNPQEAKKIISKLLEAPDAEALAKELQEKL